MKILLVALLSIAVSNAETLDGILAKMDRLAKSFQSVTASFKNVEYTAVLKELEPPALGVIEIKRGKGGAMATLKFSDPDPHTIVFKGKEAHIYKPKAKVVEDYDVSKHTGIIDQFLLLGFGTSGADLRKDYDIKLAGAESVDSIPTTKLELTPKAAEAKKVITKIELWMGDNGNAVEEKVTEPSGNYFQVWYTNVKPNAPVADSEFELKLPKDVKHIKVN